MLAKLGIVSLMLAALIGCSNNNSSNGPATPIGKSQVMGAWEIKEVEMASGERHSIQQSQNGTKNLYQVVITEKEMTFIITEIKEKESTFQVSINYIIEDRVINTVDTSSNSMPNYEIVSIDANTMKLRNVNPSNGETPGIMIVLTRIPAESLRKAPSSSTIPVSTPPPAAVQEVKKAITDETPISEVAPSDMQFTVVSHSLLNSALNSYKRHFRKDKQVVIEKEPSKNLFLKGKLYSSVDVSGITSSLDDAHAFVELDKHASEIPTLPQVKSNEVLLVSEIRRTTLGILIVFLGKNFGVEFDSKDTTVKYVKAALKDVLLLEEKK